MPGTTKVLCLHKECFAPRCFRPQRHSYTKAFSKLVRGQKALDPDRWGLSQENVIVVCLCDVQCMHADATWNTLLSVRHWLDMNGLRRCVYLSTAEYYTLHCWACAPPILVQSCERRQWKVHQLDRTGFLCKGGECKSGASQCLSHPLYAIHANTMTPSAPLLPRTRCRVEVYWRWRPRFGSPPVLSPSQYWSLRVQLLCCTGNDCNRMHTVLTGCMQHHQRQSRRAPRIGTKGFWHWKHPVCTVRQSMFCPEWSRLEAQT